MSKAGSSTGATSLFQAVKSYPTEHLLKMSPDDGGSSNGSVWYKEVRSLVKLVGPTQQWVDTFDSEPKIGTEAANRNSPHVFDARRLYPNWARTEAEVDAMSAEEFARYSTYDVGTL